MTFEGFEPTDTTEEIISRFMNLYDEPKELKELLNSFFTNAPVIRDLIGIDPNASKRNIAVILVNYLGVNFFTTTVGKSYNTDPTSNKKSEDGKYLIREKLLERICQRHDDPNFKEQILKKVNYMLHTKHVTLSELSRERWITKKQVKDYMADLLKFPDIVFESPPKINEEEETTQIGKKPQLKPLYDYQTQAVIHIYEMLSNATKPKRTLISVPTGAGKTRLTVEAIVDWINDKDMEKIPDASQQQKNGRIIFWFASTNELCSQAASEFVNIYNQLGNGAAPFNVTRLYGAGRRDIFEILEEYPGLHIVVTNTEHFQNILKNEKSNAKFLVDQYQDSILIEKLREQTIAIVIDEAHEAISDTYKKFLASMGFDFSGRNKAKEYNHNQKGIVLIGLTATPYRGSGIWTADNNPIDSESFAEFDEESDPTYFKSLDPKTKMIHKMFNGVYIPLPKESHIEPDPVPLIESPPYAYANEHVKISGLKSFDAYSDISYKWVISKFGINDTTYVDPVFYHKFTDSGIYNIKLVIANKMGSVQSAIRQIQIYREERMHGKKGNLEDNEEFNKILQKRNILCKIIYGVINGPQLEWNESDIKAWRKGDLSEENEEIIENDKLYNSQICDIINKALKKYNRKKVLLFANGVSHAHNLALILNTRYKLKAQAVDGMMNTGLRRQAIYDFRKGKIEVLCNHGILTSGFDVPDIDTLLICRTVGSNALYTQMIGRGQRGTIAGGTKDLWLITAYFKKGVYEKSIKLGWEALASSWENFPENIKNDLNIQNNKEYENENESESYIEPEIQHSTSKKIICKKCHIKAENMSTVHEIFGVSGSDEVIAKSIKDETFPKYCLTCRQIELITNKTKSVFCNKIVSNHYYDPVLLMIASFANKAQDNERESRFSDLQNYLHKTFLKHINIEYFNTQNSSVRKAEELEILKIRNNMDLKFQHINDAKSLDEIISCIWKSDQLKKRLNEILDNHKKSNSSTVVKLDPLYDAFKRLCKKYAHTPTSRQFHDGIIQEDLGNEFLDRYHDDYKKFLWDHHIILKDDLDLKDLLYEEYFEKCLEEKTEISREKLDKYGLYRISDYEEIFDSFENFRKNTKRALKNLFATYDEMTAKVDEEFELIDKDLAMMRDRLKKPLHFDDIKIHSRLGAHKYLIQTKLSYLKYLNNYYGDNPGKFLRLVKEYFRLKSILKITPTYEQFVSLTPSATTANLGKIFEFNYSKFLGSISERLEDQISSDHTKHMREEIMKQMCGICEKSSTEEAIKIINEAKNKHDELSISIKAWWPDIKKLKQKIIREYTET